MELEHREALRAAVETLERLGAGYFLFGANAQNIWGEPRFTKDVDLILFLAEDRFDSLLSALGGAGFPVESDRHVARLRSGRMLKLSHGAVSVDFVLGETEFDQSALGRRRRLRYLDLPVYVASPEDIVLYKLIAHRAHDLGDIEKIIRRQRAVLDYVYLGKWAKWLAKQTGFRRIETTLHTMIRKFGKKA